MRERHLPSKPSRLIEIALEDLEKVEKAKDYEVDMNLWASVKHDYLWEREKCSVCFAGAVMSQRTIKHRFDESLEKGARSAQGLPDRGINSNAYKALDNMRSYDIEGATKYFRRHSHNKSLKPKLEKLREDLDTDDFLNTALKKRKRFDYEDNPRKFKTNMRKIAEHFKSMGL